MHSDDEIVGIIVELHVGEELSLFILLGKDGTINRMGNGSVDDIERQLFIGKISPDLFLRVRARVTAGVIHFLGQQLAAPRPKGKLCELAVVFTYADGRDATTAWRYGSESQGPHPEVREFVMAAMEATEPWFEQQKEMVRRKRGESLQ